MTDELKPCAHCGNAEIKPMHVCNSNRPLYRVKCYKCGMQTNLDDKDKVIAAWNIRHESDELPEWVRDKIEDMIQSIFDIMSTNPQGYVKNCELLSKVHVLERVHSLRKPEEKE